jgi:hypothetical protein
MPRVTSKRVKEVVDKMRPHAVVRLSRRFLGGTAAVKLQFVLRELTLMTVLVPHHHARTALL